MKGILFDLDGTLLDTSGDIRKVLNESLSAFGLREKTPAEVKAAVGDGAYALIVRSVGDRADLIGKVYADFTVRYENSDNSLTSLFDGEGEFLRRARDSGMGMAVVTNKPQRTAENVCRKLLARYGISCIMGARDVYPMKPAPDSSFLAADLLGLSISECVFVGDGETDIATAGNAGMPCISALWGYRKKDALMKAGAKTFAEDFGELSRMIFGD